MRILYLSSSYVPSRRADSLQVMKMCAGLARRGHQVRLVSKGCPSRQERGVDDAFRFYGVPPTFTVLPLPRPQWRGGGVVFAWRLRRFLAREASAIDLAYCRDVTGAWLARAVGLPLVFEAHQPPEGPLLPPLYRGILGSRHCRLVVAITHAVAARLRDRGFVPPERRLVVAPDAADPLPPADGGPAPHPSLLESAALHVGYVGQLYAGKGAELVLELAARAPDCRFHLLGGEPAALARLRRPEPPANVVLHGFVPPADLAAWYHRFDVLLMPYQRRVVGASGRRDLAPWMSPMKLFEYMAAGKPILASDLPVLHEVLEADVTALLLPPDDPDAWAAALRRLVAEPDLRRRLGSRAQLQFLARHTWDARVERVLRAIAT